MTIVTFEGGDAARAGGDDVTAAASSPHFRRTRERMSNSLKIAGLTAALTGALGVAGSGAEAQEYCVVCSAPAKMYRCAIDNYKPGSAHNLPAVCSDAMTRVGAHAGCIIGKGITVLDCNGPLMRVDIANPASPVVTNAAEEDAKAAKAKSESGEPKTVLDMIKRAQSPSGAATQPAQPAQPVPAQPPVKRSDQPASAPGPRAPAQKANPLADTWRCMSSFFTKCGD